MISFLDACVAQHWITLAAMRHRAREANAGMTAALERYDERCGQ